MKFHKDNLVCTNSGFDNICYQISLSRPVRSMMNLTFKTYSCLFIRTQTNLPFIITKRVHGSKIKYPKQYFSIMNTLNVKMWRTWC